MSVVKCLSAAALVTAVGILSARAAESTTALSPAVAAANQDFGMLSKQGAIAFKNVQLARLAIFNGQVSKATQEVDAAQTALGKAQNDAAAYTKAESDLTPPPGMAQRKGGQDVAAGPVRWLPVDGAMTVDDSYTATPTKKAGMAKADTQLKSGDRNGAMDTLKLAGVDVSFDTEVIPLHTATTEVQNAAKLMVAGSYYEANQALKSVEDGARFDVLTVTSAPGAAGAKTATKAASAESGHSAG